MNKTFDGIVPVQKTNNKLMSKKTISPKEDIPILMPAISGLNKLLENEGRAKLTRTLTLILLALSITASLLAFQAPLAISESDIVNEKVLDERKQALYEEDVLWFARLIYSETKNPDEQIYIAWVARNRVDTGFRGNSYKEVALSSGQFSGLNTFDHNYSHNINLDYGDRVSGWDTAVEIAKIVYDAPEEFRPFPKTVRHFYSPTVIAKPSWAYGQAPVKEITNDWGGIRFAFYEGIE